MRILRRANDQEVWWIIQALCNATRRPRSEDFLSGFPWISTTWHLAEFEGDDFENLFLFWDGSAWGESAQKPPRQLRQGVQDFMACAGDITKPDCEHFVDILKSRDYFRTGGHLGCELILIGQEQKLDGPFVILDGNHRAVAALWWAYETGKRDHLPTHAWLGLSPQMLRYCRFREIEDITWKA